MTRKSGKSKPLRALNALCVTVLLGASLYTAFAGLQLAAAATILLCAAGIATPVILGAEGFMDVVTGIFEALIDGIVAIIEGIASVIAGIFG